MDIKNELHRVTSTAIICKDGKYLIVRRSLNKKAFPGRWTVPGGGLETTDYINTPKQSPDAWYFPVTESLKREIKEETGLEVGRLNYLLDVSFIRLDDIPVVTLSYYCDWKLGQVLLNDENIEYKWVDTKEAKDYDLIGGIWEEIEMTDRILNGENPEKVQSDYFKNKVL